MYLDSVIKKIFCVIDLQGPKEKVDVKILFINPDSEPHPDPLWEVDPDLNNEGKKLKDRTDPVLIDISVLL